MTGTAVLLLGRPIVGCRDRFAQSDQRDSQIGDCAEHDPAAPAGRDALAETLVRVSHLGMQLEGHLAELDINPLMVLPSGQGVKAVDALVVFRGISGRGETSGCRSPRQAL